MPPIAPPRDPDKTRQAILDVAMYEFWTQGYNGTRVDTIVEKTAYTKGAFYHHFPSKKALVSAVLEEAIGGLLRARWVEPFQNCPRPLDALIERMRELKTESSEEGVRYGCPLNNLAQEVSGVDDELRAHTNRLFQEWIGSIAAALASGQRMGQIRSDMDPRHVATHLVAVFEGGISLAKAERDAAPLNSVLDGLILYLESLRAPASATDHP
ncbi:MAG: TetR/AcrR family transcriptional regulator [Candidatus Hydrogenedentes bacterium]|nr:TetR/AcrR family transcriptional regulator [Candidatus Hydrogenedentota bacterium]